MEDIVEVDIFEEWVALDFLSVALSRAEPSCGIACQKLERYE